MKPPSGVQGSWVQGSRFIGSKVQSSGFKKVQRTLEPMNLEPREP
jgi:hypothetical protein